MTFRRWRCLSQWYQWNIYWQITGQVMGKAYHHANRQGVTTCCSLAAGLRGNVERMRKWSENEEMKRERGNGVRERILRKNKEMERE